MRTPLRKNESTRALNDPVRDGEVQSDAAALDADQDDFGPARPAERGEGRLASLAPHLPVVSQVLDAVSWQQGL
jgi:hypothetical protein